MSTAPPGDQTRPLFYRTVVAHFEGPDGETPLGVRVVEPAPETRQALRGNLYAIVDLVGENPGRAHLAESLLSAIQRTYFTRAGSQSQVLTEAVRQARLRVNEFNQSHPDQTVQLGVICAGLVRSRLMIVHSGPAFAFITADNQIVRYPTEVASFVAPSASNAAAQPSDQTAAATGNWEIYSQDVDQHTALFMGTARWLDVVPVRTIAGSVAHINTQNCGVAASGLLATSRRPDLPGLLLVVERTDTPPVPPAPQASPPQRRSPLLGATAGLMTSVNAPPPVVGVPQLDGDALPQTESLVPEETVPEETTSAISVPAAVADSQIGEVASAAKSEFDVESGALEAFEISEAEEDTADDSQLVRPEEAYHAGDGAADPEPSGPSTMAKISSGLAAGALLGVDRVREILAGVFPERRPASAIAYDGESAQPNPADSGFSDIDATDPDDSAWEADLPVEMAAAGASATVHNTTGYANGPVTDDVPGSDASLAGDNAGVKPPFHKDVANRVSAALDESATPFVPPEPASGGRARLFITLAVLILVLVPVMVAAVYQQWGQDTTISIDAYTEMAETFLLNAQVSLDNGDTDSAREMFLKADDSLTDAVALSGHTERTDQLFDEINSGLAEVMQTRYLYQLTEPLVSFPNSAEPFRIMTVGESLFVMDREAHTIERFELDTLGEYVPDPQPEVIMREGQSVDGATVGGMVDMAWQPIVAGYEDRPKLLVLDSNGQIFSYDLRVDGVQPVEQDDTFLLQNASQIELFLGRTYIADEGRNQIFRYAPGGLGDEPTPWFPEETQPYISGLLAMAIDGDIWLLNSEGTLVRYNSGEQVPFSLDSGAVRADEPVDMAVGAQADSSIFIADAAHDRILAFDKQGGYQYQLVAREGEPLADLRGIYLDEIDEKIYILTKSALYQHPLPE